jgi:phospholipid-binding lipoprotein MlaA
VAATVAAPDGAAPPSEPSEQEEAPGIVVQGDAYSRQDPVHAVNEKSYEAIQKGDKLVVAPVARLYAHGVPSPLRRGLHNALYNLREPSNFVAFLLEHKFGKAGQVLVRFTVNSTIGLAGLIDVAKAKPLRIPYRPNGLADVAGFYGIKSGPYLFLPLIGPTTLRDLIGTTIDRAWFPLAVGKPLDTVPYGLAVTVIGGLDDRNAIDGQLRKFREESADPYNATRDFYLKRRQAEIDALRHPTRRGAQGRRASPRRYTPGAQGPTVAPACRGRARFRWRRSRRCAGRVRACRSGHSAPWSGGAVFRLGRGDAHAIVADEQHQRACAVFHLDLDRLGLGMAHRVAQRFAGNRDDFVGNVGLQRPHRAFDRQADAGSGELLVDHALQLTAQVAVFQAAQALDPLAPSTSISSARSSAGTSTACAAGSWAR